VQETIAKAQGNIVQAELSYWAGKAKNFSNAESFTDLPAFLQSLKGMKPERVAQSIAAGGAWPMGLQLMELRAVELAWQKFRKPHSGPPRKE